MEFVPGPRTFPLLCAAFVALLALPGASAIAAPQAKVGPVSCDSGGSVVTLSNDSGAPARFELLRDEHVVAVVTVPAGPPVTRVVPIAEGVAAQVTARFGGGYSSGYVRRGCRPETSEVAASVPASTSSDDAPFVATPVVPATGTNDAVRASVAADTSAPASEPSAQRGGSVWPALGFAGIAIIALAAAARLLSRGSRTVPDPERIPARSA